MVGTSPAELFPPRTGRGPDRTASSRPPSIVVQGLTVDEELRDVSFEARPGEIVGLAGLEGSGVATLLGVLFGTRRASGGASRSPTAAGAPASPTAAARRGISLVPADRRHQGLMLESSIETQHRPGRASAPCRARRPWLDRRAMRAAARRQIESLRIRADGPRTTVGSCRVATSRRSSSASGWRSRRRSSCWTTRPGASTSARSARSTG